MSSVERLRAERVGQRGDGGKLLRHGLGNPLGGRHRQTGRGQGSALSQSRQVGRAAGGGLGSCDGRLIFVGGGVADSSTSFAGATAIVVRAEGLLVGLLRPSILRLHAEGMAARRNPQFTLTTHSRRSRTLASNGSEPMQCCRSLRQIGAQITCPRLGQTYCSPSPDVRRRSTIATYLSFLQNAGPKSAATQHYRFSRAF